MAGRGRPKAPTKASTLLEALAFVEPGTRDDDEYQNFVRLSGNVAIAFNGQVAAGHPIAEELTLCPHLERFAAAISRCGKSLVISETPAGQISVKGDKLRALIPAMREEELPSVAPDPVCVDLTFKLNGDEMTAGEVLKEGFKVAGAVATEAAPDVVSASLLLEANTVTGSNRVSILQFWHGINLPPLMVLPKAFTAAVVKQSKALIGFGFSWSADGSMVNSVTFHFDGGGWIKSQCYADRWPDVGSVLNVRSVPADALSGLFDAIEAVSKFSDDEWITFGDDKVMSHLTEEAGATYAVKGLQGGSRFKGKLVKLVAPYAQRIDMTTYPAKAFFFGGDLNHPIRGAIIGIDARTSSED